MIEPTWELERQLWSEGFEFLVGVDEAGRGPWAGPVVAGAVLWREEKECEVVIRDSKRMSERQRNEAYEYILANADGWGAGVVSAEQIDRIGIQEGVRKAMSEAVEKASQNSGRADFVMVDGGNILDLDGYKQKKINKGDLLHFSISCAAIIAKVTRDRLMVELDQKYPQYGFAGHKGYGTKLHKEALEKFGPTPVHRLSYKPVATVAQKFGYKRERV